MFQTNYYLQESPARAAASDKGTPIPVGCSQEKDSATKAGPDKVKGKTDDEGKQLPAELNGKADLAVNMKSEKSESSLERSWESGRDISRGQDRDGRGRDSDRESRGRDSDRERDQRHRSREKSSGIA